MIIYGYDRVDLDDELDLARSLGAALLEILPLWSALPDPVELARRVASRGFSIHSAHGCLGRPDHPRRPRRPGFNRRDDSRRLNQRLDEMPGLARRRRRQVPGRPPRRIVRSGRPGTPSARLWRGLLRLADHARGQGVLVCVENMPPGVHPGSRMTDLAALLRELAHPQLALALDTGHANLGEGLRRNPGRRHASGNDPRARQRRPARRSPPARPRHDRLGRMGEHSRFHPILRADCPRMHQAPA